ncbi:MAG: hypothetical protein QOJ15_4023 [Bradyrhizobium sp.]|nr:hypothetical protein [Bradyrhizobium sp.]
MGDQKGLRGIGLAFSALTALAALMAVMTVATSIGAP